MDMEYGIYIDFYWKFCDAPNYINKYTITNYRITFFQVILFLKCAKKRFLSC